MRYNSNENSPSFSSDHARGHSIRGSLGSQYFDNAGSSIHGITGSRSRHQESGFSSIGGSSNIYSDRARSIENPLGPFGTPGIPVIDKLSYSDLRSSGQHFSSGSHFDDHSLTRQHRDDFSMPSQIYSNERDNIRKHQRQDTSSSYYDQHVSSSVGRSGDSRRDELFHDERDNRGRSFGSKSSRGGNGQNFDSILHLPKPIPVTSITDDHFEQIEVEASRRYEDSKNMFMSRSPMRSSPYREVSSSRRYQNVENSFGRKSPLTMRFDDNDDGNGQFHSRSRSSRQHRSRSPRRRRSPSYDRDTMSKDMRLTLAVSPPRIGPLRSPTNATSSRSAFGRLKRKDTSPRADGTKSRFGRGRKRSKSNSSPGRNSSKDKTRTQSPLSMSSQTRLDSKRSRRSSSFHRDESIKKRSTTESSKRSSRFKKDESKSESSNGRRTPSRKMSRSKEKTSSNSPPRVSALKRLGPKLSISDRLGNKGFKSTKDKSKPFSKKPVSKDSDEKKSSSGSDNKRESKTSSTKEKLKDQSVEKDNNPDVTVTIKSKSETKEEVRIVDDNEADRGSVSVGGKKFVKLVCPHCNEKKVTFVEYTNHLGSKEHDSSMNKLKHRLHLSLIRMRKKQRLQQGDLETKLDANLAEGEKRHSSVYCKVCKLVFHQPREEHNASNMHKLISKFLNPRCNICSQQFFSPMAYERHIATLNHIKKRAEVNENDLEEEDLQKIVDYADDNEDDSSEEFDMENFVTLDEVGQVEEEPVEKKAEKVVGKKTEQETEKQEEKEQTEPEEKEKIESQKKEKDLNPNKKKRTFKKITMEGFDEEEKKDKPIVVKNRTTSKDKEETVNDDNKNKEDITKENDNNKNNEDITKENDDSNNTSKILEEPVGESYIKRVEMFYCDLCHKYLPKFDPEQAEEQLKMHCRSQSHRNAYTNKHPVASVEETNETKDVPETTSDDANNFNEEQLDYEAE